MLCTCKRLAPPVSEPDQPTTPAGTSQPTEDAHPEQTNGCVDMLVIGDYGTRDSAQRSVAAGLAKVAAERDPVAIAGIGDNIYGSGAEGNPQLIVDWWLNVYLSHSSLKRPWYIITGNHDWYTDARTERDFTWHPKNVGGWWRMPSFWFKRSFLGSGFSIDAFFIDTQIWKGSSQAEAALGGGAREEQISWLTEELGRSTADWKFVFGHHPVYSAGSHGITDTMLEELDPLMRRFGVQALFSGHDHSQQLMRHRGMNYIISGAGGARARPRSDEYPQDSQRVLLESLGFAGLSVCNKSVATVSFYGADGHPQAAESLSSAVPDPFPELGRPALANGAAASAPPHAVCGGVSMPDVEVVCIDEGNSASGCKVLADGMRYKTCREYCARSNLRCKGGWEEADEDCVPTHVLGCDQTFGSTSDLICECASL